MSSEDKIKKDIKEHIASRGGKYSDWYVGITADPKKRLFEEHRVNEKTDKWIYREASSSDVARSTEDHFVNTCKTDGDVGGGDDTSIYVYAYRKNDHTDP
jgi:hypothetical protein